MKRRDVKAIPPSHDHPLHDFIPWEPGTSYQFCRTEVKNDGGKCERRLAQNGFCSSKKKIINDDCLESLNTKNLGELCNSLKLKASGTKSELLQRLLPFKDDPALLDNRVKNISVKYSFATALSRKEIPPPTAGWKCNTSLFPKISKDVIKTYQSNKRQGMIGQFRKARRMFSSRRMKP